MKQPDVFEKAISQAKYWRDICIEAAGSPKLSPMAGELKRLAEMWEGFAVQVEDDARRVAEARDFLARIDQQSNRRSHLSGGK